MSRSRPGSLPDLFDDALHHLESASPKDLPQDGFGFFVQRQSL
jgi:hypothetical protein